MPANQRVSIHPGCVRSVRNVVSRFQADDLCLWKRELAKAENALGYPNQDVPWCIE